MFLFSDPFIDLLSGDLTEFWSISLEFVAWDLFFLKSAMDLELPLVNDFKDLWYGDVGEISIDFSSF